MYSPQTTWTRLFLAVVVAQCLSALCLESYVFTAVEGDLEPESYQVDAGHTMPMYFSLCIFGFVYELVLVWDALRLSSMIQIVGLCIYNLSLLAYAAFQPASLETSIRSLEGSLIMGIRPLLNPDKNLWARIHPALLALIGVLAVGTVALGFITFKLRTEYAWLVYQVIHADLSMKRRVFTLQTYIALIKFGSFFFIGFLVQNMVIHLPRDTNLILSISGICVSMLVAGLAIVFVYKESKTGTVAVVGFYLLGIAYLIYQLTHLPGDYPTLTIFGIITLVIVLCTMIAAVICLVNFDKGLRAYTQSHDLLSRKKLEEEINLQHAALPVSQLLPRRMALD